MITIVSGLPRSGTSMMMQCLIAGGMPAVYDESIRPDKHNPRGYFEHRPALLVHAVDDMSWLDRSEGGAIKVMAYGLMSLPLDRDYRIILMRRNIQLCSDSLADMYGSDKSDNSVVELYGQRLSAALQYLEATPQLKVIQISYDSIIESPSAQVDRIVDFLGVPLDRVAMAAAVAPELRHHTEVV